MSDYVRPHRRPPTRLLCPGILQARTLLNSLVSWDDLIDISPFYLAQTLVTPEFSPHGKVLKIAAHSSCGVQMRGCILCKFFSVSVNRKASARNAGDLGSIPGWGRSPGGGHGNPLQYSCLENPTDRGAWWATAHGVAKSWTH